MLLAKKELTFAPKSEHFLDGGGIRSKSYPTLLKILNCSWRRQVKNFLVAYKPNNAPIHEARFQDTNCAYKNDL